MFNVKNILKGNSSLSLISKSGVASADRVRLSAVSFLISTVLMNTFSKAECGSYSIAFPISLFLASIQNAIMNTPTSRGDWRHRGLASCIARNRGYPNICRQAELVSRICSCVHSDAVTAIAAESPMRLGKKIPSRLFMVLKALAYGRISLVFMVSFCPGPLLRTQWLMEVASNPGRFLAAFDWYYKGYR